MNISEASLNAACRRLRVSPGIVEKLVSDGLLQCKNGEIPAAAIESQLRSNSFLLVVSRLRRQELESAAEAEAKAVEAAERRTKLLAKLEQAKADNDHESAVAICDKLLQLEGVETNV